MAGYGSSANISGSSNSSYSGAQQTPQSEFSLQIANAAAAVGQYVVKWAQQVYAQTSAITDQMVTNFLQASQYGMQLAETQLNQYTNTYVPEMNQLAGEAATYSSPSRVAYNMGAAGANAASGAYAANQGTLQNLRSYGVDPSSGMYGDILAAQNTAAGASEAGAENQAQVNTEATGRQLLQNSITAGEQLPGDTVNALNSAYQGIAGAENSVLSNANTGSQALATAAPFFQAATNVKMPSSSTVSKGSSGSIGGSSSAPQQKQQPMGNMGQGARPAGPGLPGTATAGGPGGPETISGPFAPDSGAGSDAAFSGPPGSIDSINPSGGQYSDFGTSNPETQLGNDPFNQQFTNYSGDTSNPYTSSTDPGASNPFGATDQSFTNGSFGDTNQSTFSTPSAPAGGWGSGNSSPSGVDNGSYSSPPSGVGNSGFDSSFDNGTSSFQNYGGAGGDQPGSGDYGAGNAGASAGSYGGGAGGGAGGGYYTKGGRVQRNFRPGVLPVSNATTGGRVPMQASPSQGRQTDDVPARLNAGEFVIPKDVTAWKGQEFFQKLIDGSRKKRVTGSPARGQPKPALRGPPRFVSHQMGAR